MIGDDLVRVNVAAPLNRVASTAQTIVTPPTSLPFTV